MVDLHSHILPGLDDGAETLEAALEIARAAVEDGIRVIAATPHVRDDYPTTPDEMERALEDVREELAGAGVELDVVGGGEIALDRLDRLSDDELGRFALAGSRYLLVETPYVGWPLDIAERLFVLRGSGFVPVLGHPERNAEVQRSPERLAPLVESGALVQITAASLDGRLGKRAREAAFRLIELECAHMIASDAHSAGVRAIGMTAAADAVDDRSLADWLTREAPAAIVADAELPARPRRRRGLFGRLLRG